LLLKFLNSFQDFFLTVLQQNYNCMHHMMQLYASHDATVRIT